MHTLKTTQNYSPEKEAHMSIRVPELRQNEDGTTYFDNEVIPLKMKDFSPPAPPVAVSAPMAAKRVYFISGEAGYVGDWHPKPFPLLIIVLKGIIEIESTSGDKVVLEAGDSSFEKIQPGLIHRTCVIGKNRAYAAIVELDSNQSNMK